MPTSFSSGSLSVPRDPLAVRTAGHLETAIRSGVWTGMLPGEREMVSRLQVSRTTVRGALQILEDLGLVERLSGQGRRITSSITAKNKKLRRPVILLSPLPLEQLEHFTLLWIEHFQALLQLRGRAMEVRVRPTCFGKQPQRELRGMMDDAEAWILLRSTRAMQEWFSGRKLPFLVTGTAFSPRDAFHVDFDLAAVSRHAAVTFCRQGHRRAAIFLGDSRRAGEQASEKGFREGCGDFCQATVLSHGDSPQGLKKAINLALALRPSVTGILCADGRQVTMLVSRLLNAGFKIPRDMSVISRDDDAILDYLTPGIARYRRSPKKFATKCAALLEAAISGTRPRGVLLAPDFFKAESLGPPG